MISDDLDHAAIMHALTQPQSLIETNPQSNPHITSIWIRGKNRDDDYDRVNDEDDYPRKYDVEPRYRAVGLRDRYGFPNIDKSREDSSIRRRTEYNPVFPRPIAPCDPEDPPKVEEIDKNLVEFLKNKEQDNSKTVLLESIINVILDKLKFNSKSFGSQYDYIYLCGSEYLCQIMNDTHLTSLSFLNNDMTKEWFYKFAEHLQRSQISSLVLPIISDDPLTFSRLYKKVDTSVPNSSSCDNIKYRTRKRKVTEGNTSCVEEIQNSSLEHFASIIKDTEIRCLDFGGNPVNLKMLSCSLVDSKLTSLSLGACKLQINGLSFLASIIKDTQINSIDLSGNQLDCKSFKIFVAGLKGSNITSLNLSSNRIGVVGMNCLARVLKATKIASLDISDNKFEYKSLKVFLNHLVDSKITSLSLKNNDICFDDLICLGRVLKNTQITSLDVSGIEFNRESMKIFASCLVDTKITFLCLQSNRRPIDIEILHMLLDVIGNTGITSLDLQNNNRALEDRNPDGINRLERVLTNPQITSINIGNAVSFNQFSSSLMGSNITHLGLKNQCLTINELEYLGDVLKNSKISSIDLSYNKLGTESFKIFVPYLVDSKITTLDLSGNEPHYDGINCLGTVLKNTNIISLNLSNCTMKCYEVEQFVINLPDSKIKSLNLSDNVICCNSFYLAFILKHTEITILDISSQKFNTSDDPVRLVELFNYNSKFPEFGYDYEYGYDDDSRFKSIYLNDRNLCTAKCYFLARNLRSTKFNNMKVTIGKTDIDYLKYLSQGLLYSCINYLDLTSNNIDSSGAQYLAEVLKHTAIKQLNLAKNEVKDKGLKYLMEGFRGSRLQYLNLSTNFISDEGIQGLAESLEDTQLDELDLRNNRISSGAAYNLSESIEQRNLHPMYIRIDFKDQVYACLHLFKYQNCFVEFHELRPEERIAEFVKKVYQRAGIIHQLVLEGGGFPHVAGAFDNMDIIEAVTISEENSISPIGMDGELMSCLEKANIADLLIDWCYLSPNSFENMKVIGMSLLQYYDSYCCDADFVDLHSSLLKSNLVYLDLSGNDIGEGEFTYLVNSLPGSKIISLNLGDNSISESCIQSLVEVLPATNITYINLDGNSIGFQGFKDLMNVVDNTKLCWLSLENTRIETYLAENIQLTPYIVPRKVNPIEFQIRYLFKELVNLNSSTEQFEFIVPHDDSCTTIFHYPRLVKLLLERPDLKMHIYDYFYMLSKTPRHSLQLLNKINFFIEHIKPKFISFFESNVMKLQEMFDCDSFVRLVEEFNTSNLTEFVEFLLLHRVLYYVDNDENFLHPRIYKMLHKHKMPMYSEEMEPNKKQHIISYFERHSHLDGAQEIVDLLK